MSTRKFISLFLLAVMLSVTARAGVVFTSTRVAGSASAVMTIRNSATPGHFTATVVITGSFGLYGNFQGPFWVNGPNFYADVVGTYGPIDLDATQYPDGVSTGYWGGQQQSGGPYSGNDVIIIPKWTEPTPDGQTVTITPTALTISQGRQASFTASGGHNGYLWSLTGGGSLAENGGENALFSATSEGTFTVQVRSPAGNGYAVSNFATATITVTKASRVKIKLPENKGYRPVEYMIMQGSTTLGIETQMPGALSRTVEKVVTTDEPVTVLSRVVGIVQDDDSGVWKAEPGAVMTPTTTPPITPSPNPDVIDVKAPNAPNKPSDKEGDQSNKNVWSNVSNTNSTTNVTNAVYREGTDKTTAAMDKVAEGNEKILEELKKQREAQDKATKDVSDQVALENAVFGAALSAALAAGEPYGEAVRTGREIAGVTVTPSAPNGDVWTVSDKYLGMISLNPFGNSRVLPAFQALAAWVRNIVGWGVVIALSGYTYREMRKAMVALMQIPVEKFTTENVVQGSMWTTLTTYLARPVLKLVAVSFILALPTACIQLFSTEWSQVGITFAAAVTSGATSGGGGESGGLVDFIALANCIIPVATILSAGTTYAAIQFGLLNLQSVWMVFFRFNK